MPETTEAAGPPEGAHTSTTGATIELENLTKRYPSSREPAVDSVNMEIKAGELVVFVGPSGCGKSTTLKMINRLIEPTSGRIRINAEDVTDMDPVKLRRKIGYAIQASGLFPHMTVAQNIALVPKMVGWSKSRVRARVEEMLDLVGPTRPSSRDVIRASSPAASSSVWAWPGRSRPTRPCC